MHSDSSGAFDPKTQGLSQENTGSVLLAEEAENIPSALLWANIESPIDTPFQTMVLEPVVHIIEAIDKIALPSIEQEIKKQSLPTRSIEQKINEYIVNFDRDEKDILENRVRTTYPFSVYEFVLDGVTDMNVDNIKDRHRIFQEELAYQKMFEQDKEKYGASDEFTLKFKTAKRAALNAERASLFGGRLSPWYSQLTKQISELDDDIEDLTELDEL